MRENTLVVLLVLACTLAGCAREPFRYGPAEYPSADAALAAVRGEIDGNVAAVQSLPAPLAGSVAIYVPSADFARRGVRDADAASRERARFIASALHAGFRGMAESIRRRGIFAQAEVRDLDGVKPDDPGDADYVVWLELVSPNATQWYVAPRGALDAPQPLDLPLAPDVRERVAGWLDALAQYVGERAAAAPPSP